MNRHILHERRCDCLACFAWRLAFHLFLAGLAALLMVAAILHASEPLPLLIEISSADRGAQ